MEFELNEEQLELQRVAREVAEREIPASLLRRVVEDGDDTGGLWKTLTAMEWPGLTVPAAQGGSEASTVELMVIVEQLGWAADPSPFLATTTQFVPLLRSCATGPVRDELLGAVCAGATGAAVGGGSLRARRDGDDWLLDGTATWMLDADRADHVAVIAPSDEGLGLFVTSPDSWEVDRRPSVDGSLHLSDVRMRDVRVPSSHAWTGDAVAAGARRCREEALVGLATHMVGASQRVLDMVIDHVKQRHQFGVPIGSFQAVKHMIVDVYVAIERARAICQFAARTIAEDDERSGVAASMAKAAAGDAQRIAVQHGIQLFGALGFTWEHDLQLYVKRAKTLDLLGGSAHEHRRKVAESILGGSDASITLQLDAKAEAFREELRAWLDAHTPDPSTTTERSTSSSNIPEWSRQFQRAMFDAGWLLPGNAPEFGGRNATLIETFVHQEELSSRRIYHSFNPQGLSIITPSILAFGTHEQKLKWAVPLMRAEVTASLGMSEPDAGSDLAGLRTRAQLDGDHFVVNGQKVWTSGAHDADFILAFVRTDPDAPKHKGISCLIIPTDTPGVTRRPFGSLDRRGDLDFNEVFFDDAIVPAENLIGELHDGWRVATGSLGHERAMLWLGYADRLDDLVERGGKVLRERGLDRDAYMLDWFAQTAIDRQALRLLGYQTLTAMQRGFEPRAQSILKLLGSEAALRATLEMTEAVGPDALDAEARSAPFEPYNLDVWTMNWFDLYLRGFSMTIAGGTSQIQKNIIAERVLGLPRG